jgi:hypothetical protein
MYIFIEENKVLLFIALFTLKILGFILKSRFMDYHKTHDLGLAFQWRRTIGVCLTINSTTPAFFFVATPNWWRTIGVDSTGFCGASRRE